LKFEVVRSSFVYSVLRLFCSLLLFCYELYCYYRLLLRRTLVLQDMD
jgi:hypothetical protein